MSGGRSMLPPRGLDHGLEDLASPSPLITRQRVGRRQHRLRTNRRARRMGRLAGGLAVGTGLLAGGAPGRGLAPPAVETLPQIRLAEVIRTFPNRLTIVVEERRPFTLVHAGRLHWIDEQGRPGAQEARAA